MTLIDILDGEDKSNLDVKLVHLSSNIVKGWAGIINVGKYVSGAEVYVNLETETGEIIDIFTFDDFIFSIVNFNFHLNVRKIDTNYLISIDSNIPGSLKFYYTENGSTIDRDLASKFSYRDLLKEEIVFEMNEKRDEVKRIYAKVDLFIEDSYKFIKPLAKVKIIDQQGTTMVEQYSHNFYERIKLMPFFESDSNQKYYIYYEIFPNSSQVNSVIKGYYSFDGTITSMKEATPLTGTQLNENVFRIIL